MMLFRNELGQGKRCDFLAIVPDSAYVDFYVKRQFEPKVLR